MLVEDLNNSARPQQDVQNSGQKAQVDAALIGTIDFLRHVLPDFGSGYPCIAWPRQKGKRSWFDHYPCDTIEQAAAKAMELARFEDVYFGTGTLKKPKVWDPSKRDGEGGYAYRTHANIAWFRCLFLDLDCGFKKDGTQKDYPDQRTAVASLLEFFLRTKLPRPTTISSGYGVHVYWTFDRAIPASEWLDLSSKFKLLLDKLGFKADPARIIDMSSILRVVGTFNRKDPANPKLVKVKGGLQPHTAVEELHARIEAALYEATQGGGADMSSGAKDPLTSGPDACADAIGESPAGWTKWPDTPESAASIRAMHARLDPDANRSLWLRVVYATLATGLSCAEALAREWSMRGEKWDAGAFDALVASFDPRRPDAIGPGTLVKLARDAGYDGPVPRQDGAAGDTAASAGDQGYAINGNPTAAIYRGGDKATGRLFAAMHRGKLLFVPEWRSWIAFDPALGWTTAPFAAERGKKAVSDAMFLDSMEVIRRGQLSDREKRELRDFVERASKRQQMLAMIEEAKSEPSMSISAVALDAEPMRLGVLNGELDLNNQQLTQVTPTSRVTMRCPVAFHPAATCPTWDRFMEQIVPDPEERAFAQRLAGYFLTGLTREHKFVLMRGRGGNGKSTFMETLAFVLGPHAVKLPAEAVMKPRQPGSASAATPEVVALKGARLAYIGETEDGQRLNTARIKEWTGGDTMTGRQLYRDTIRFAPTFKLTVVGNPKVGLDDTSRAMKRRLIYFEFRVAIANVDTKLRDKLEHESSGILNWMLAGLHDYLAGGLCVPASMEAAAGAYLKAEDVLGNFLDDKCDIGPSFSVSKVVLRSAYERWCTENGHPPMSQTRLTRELSERDIDLDGGKRTFKGARVKPLTLPLG